MNSKRRKNTPSKKSVRKTIILILVIAVILAIAVSVLRGIVKNKYGVEMVSNILEAEVERGSISMSVTGSGTLSDDDTEKLEIPNGVKIEKIIISRGDTVNAGDKLASVDMNSVVSAMENISEKIELIDRQINAASGEKINSKIMSPVDGRVETICAVAGDDVASVMYENGALMVLSASGSNSAEGTLELRIEAEELKKGDTVFLLCPDKKIYESTVAETDGKTAKILVADKGHSAGDEVTVENSARETVGEGKLEINEPIKIIGYTGTVKSVNVKIYQNVKKGAVLFELTDTEYSSNYHTLLNDREKLEKELNCLITIYKEGGIYSTLAGTVKEINAEEGSTGSDTQTVSSSSSSNAGVNTYSAMGGMSAYSAAGSSFGGTSESTSASDAEKRTFSICPDKAMSLSIPVDESEILSVSVGQRATVTIDSIEDKTFEGTVTDIDKFGSSSGGVTAYTATIQIEKSVGMLAGMSANASVIIDSMGEGLIVPADALNKTSAGYYVYTSHDEENGTLGGMKEVTVGITNSKSAEILSGLSEGETVYYVDPSKKNLISFGGMTFDMDEMNRMSSERYASMDEGSSYGKG